MHFILFGRLTLQNTAADVLAPPLPKARKAVGLLGYLLLFHDRTHTREKLAALYWGDVSDEKARSSLSVALFALRPLLEAAGATLEADRATITLRLGAATLDVAELERALEPSATQEQVAAALQLYSADLLEGWSDDWLLAAREQLRRAALVTGTRLAREYLSAQNWSAGVALLQRLLQHDPLNDALHDLLLRCLLGLGDYAGARRHYQATAALLRNELKTEPSASMQALYAAAQERASATLAHAHSDKNDVAEPKSTSFVEGRLPFVGRRPEQAQLLAALERAASSSGSVALVGGEAGVGKTRLVEQALRQGGKLLLARGRAHELSASVPYAPLLGLLNEWFVEKLAPQQTLARLGHIATAALAQLLPRLGVLIPQLRPLPTLAPAEEGARLLESVVAALLALVKSGAPVVLFVDDLQWADSFTFQALERLRQQIAAMPLLLIGTYRSDEVITGSPLAKMIRLMELDQSANFLLNVATLTASEARELVEPRMPEGQATLSAWLLRQSGGNAFYLAELLRSLIDLSIVAADPVSGGWRLLRALPQRADFAALTNAQAVIMARTEHLSGPTQDLIRVAATLEEATSFETLRRVSGLAEEDALAALEEALARRFLRQSANSTDYLLLHDLIRQAIYEAISLPRRQFLHEKVGAALEPEPGETLDPQRTYRIAYHYGRSANTGKQRQYFALAAAVAQSSFANDVALDYYLRLIPLLAGAERIDALLKLATLREHTGQYVESSADLRVALQLAQERADLAAVRRAKMALGALAARRGANVEALDWLGQLGDAASEWDDQAELLLFMEKLGEVLWLTNAFDEAIRCFQRMLPLAEALADRSAIGRAHGLLGRVYTDRNEPDLALRNLLQALDVAVELGDRTRETSSCWALGYYYVVQEDFRHSVLWHGRALQLAAEIGYRRARAVTLSGFGMPYLNFGDYSNARRIFLAQLQLAVELGGRLGMLIGSENMATLQAVQGHAAEAEQNWSRAIALGHLLPNEYYLAEHCYRKAEFLASQGRYTESLACAQVGLQAARNVEHTDYVLRNNLLIVYLNNRLAKLDQASAVAECEALLPEGATEPQRAAVFYTTWLIDPTKHAQQSAAAAIYRRLYEVSPTLEYRQRYRALTGLDLELPAPLPAPPESIPLEPPDPAPLFAAVDALIAELTHSAE